jgi:hypothetical protein
VTVAVDIVSVLFDMLAMELAKEEVPTYTVGVVAVVTLVMVAGM